MQITKTEINPHQLELTVHVSRAEAAPHLSRAAAALSERQPIKGFRPGKAPYDVAKKHFGEEAILQEALETIVNSTFNEALQQEHLNTYGRINFELLPALDPQTIVSYKAAVTPAPKAVLGDWKRGKIARQLVTVTDDELTKALDELATMLIKEIPVQRPAQLGDKVRVDFRAVMADQTINGSEAKDFDMILGEGRMIPGFEDQIIGHAASDEIKFTLSFPTDYHAKNLSGKPADFTIKLHEIFSREKPEISDELAKRVGVADLAELKKVLSENIRKEKTEHEEERVEIAGIKQVVDTAQFSPVPPAMIEDTVTDIVRDFEHTLAHRQMKMDDYLASINKTLEQVRRDFEPKAVERIKSSIALGQLAEDEGLGVTSQEIDAEIAALKQAHAGHNHDGHTHSPAEYDAPEYRRHVATSLINRKIIDFIKQQIIE